MDREYMDNFFNKNREKIITNGDKKESECIGVDHNYDKQTLNNLKSQDKSEIKCIINKTPKRMTDEEIKFLLAKVEEDCAITLKGLQDEIFTNFGKKISLHILNTYLQTFKGNKKKLRMKSLRKVFDEDTKSKIFIPEIKEKKKHKFISDEKREDLIRISDTTDLPIKEIANLLQINQKTAHAIVQTYHRTGMIRKKPKGTNNPKKLTDEEITQIRFKAQSENSTLKELREFVLKEYGKTVCSSTISFYVKSYRIPVNRYRGLSNKRTLSSHKSATLFKKAKVDYPGEQYIITEYPTDHGYFVVVITNYNGKYIYEKSGKIGDTLVLELCGNIISYEISGNNEDGSIRQTDVFVEDPVNELPDSQYQSEPRRPQKKENKLTKTKTLKNGTRKLPSKISRAREEYSISEEIVLTTTGMKQMARLTDKTGKVLDTKYGVKSDCVKLQVGKWAVEYTIQGPIRATFAIDPVSGVIEQEANQHLVVLAKSAFTDHPVYK